MDRDKTRYAIYARISTKKESLDLQIRQVVSYIRKIKKSDVCMIYEDNGISGKNTQRQGFQDLINDIKQQKIDVVVSTEVSRISRYLLDFQNFLSLCDKHGVIFHSLDGGIKHYKQK